MARGTRVAWEWQSPVLITGPAGLHRAQVPVALYRASARQTSPPARMRMGSDVPPTQDHIGKDFFAHPLAASALLNTVMSRAAGPLGIAGPFLPSHVEPVLGQELQSIEATDMRRVDLMFWIKDPDRGQTLGVVHVEVQSADNHPCRCVAWSMPRA